GAHRSGEHEVLVVQPADAIVRPERPIVIDPRVVEAAELDVVHAIAPVRAHRGGRATETIGSLGGAARGPLHVLVAEGYGAAEPDVRTGSITDDQLERIELVCLLIVIAHI